MASDGADQRPEGDGREFLAQSAHVAHILLAVAGVDHAARAEEEQRFEERVRHQVPDAGGEGADADAEEHVAELRNRGVGENLLDIVLREADGGGEDGGGESDDGHGFHGDRARG